MRCRYSEVNGLTTLNQAWDLTRRKEAFVVNSLSLSVERLMREMNWKREHYMRSLSTTAHTCQTLSEEINARHVLSINRDRRQSLSLRYQWRTTNDLKKIFRIFRVACLCICIDCVIPVYLLLRGTKRRIYLSLTAAVCIKKRRYTHSFAERMYNDVEL